RLGEAARKQLIIHPNSKPPAGDSWLRNLNNSGSDLPTLSDERIVRLNPFGREIFAELTVSKRSADLLFPPPCVFDGVRVDRFIGSPMRFSIRLGISIEVYTSSGDPTGDRRFPDGTLGSTTVVFELPNGTDVDRENPRHPSRHWFFSFPLTSPSS